MNHNACSLIVILGNAKEITMGLPGFKQELWRSRRDW